MLDSAAPVGAQRPTTDRHDCRTTAASSANHRYCCTLTTVRTIPPAVAAVLEQLELDQPLVVSSEDLKRAIATTESKTTIRYLVEELTNGGWLLPLRTRGYWEFAPAARAGAIDAGDPHIELRATLQKRPDLPVELAAESAAWLLGLSTRSPNRHVISAPPGLRLPPALSEYRVVRFIPALDVKDRDGLPIWQVPTLLVAMSHRPASYHDWPNVGDWLTQATKEVSEDDVRAELAGKPRSTWMRLAYLLDRGGDSDLASALKTDAPAGHGPYYLGRRGQRGRYSSKFDVIDSALIDFQT